ncbi:glycosyltransferase family 1 protein [Pedobacter sp. LMG 31464]|uniref:Glycosyltransferase family 1 protein n=1 Tax=Pedobacter planticolens TaxID=2679964 RepID=A0A923DWS0_9SPHI|nr:glycosyltransferase [Pedobacter planticolens]MBB2144095.1 glycosyltransferase family 1 protein [Pedobacter planticolens]
MKKDRLLIYFKEEPRKDSFIYGDRYLILLIKKILFPKKVSSLERVFINLCKGFDFLKVEYIKNLPFHKIRKDDRIITLGIGKSALKGYKKSNKIIAGIGLMTHPSNWPNLFKEYPISVYLQHSEWTAAIYNRWYGENHCKIWPAGIDTNFWKPKENSTKKHLLLYVKFLWNKEENEVKLLAPIELFLKDKQISYKIIRYGSYSLTDYKELLQESIGMIFLCEHESQGLAYQEAMSMNVPILAWDKGVWLDSNRFDWGEKELVPASSAPYFSEECGEKFHNLLSFKSIFNQFYAKSTLHEYSPRNYVINNLSLEKSASKMLEIIKEVYGS